MEKQKRIKIAFIINICIFALEVLSIIWILSGFTITDSSILAGSKKDLLKYFTLDSNIFMGIVALLAAIYEYMILKGKMNNTPKYCCVLKLASTVGVTLTMLVTVFYLTPLFSKTYGWFALFENSNFLLHLLCPLLSVIVYIFFEKENTVGFLDNLYSLIPVGLYTAYYVTVTLTHLDGDVPMPGYDWYGFMLLGKETVPIVVILFGVITFAISIGLWWLNRKREKNK